MQTFEDHIIIIIMNPVTVHAHVCVLISAFRRTGCSTTVVSWRRGEEDYICTKRQNVIKKWKTLLKKVLKL
jgi:hypothetical protein